jgi:uncharacterized protein (DUF433 family)
VPSPLARGEGFLTPSSASACGDCPSGPSLKSLSAGIYNSASMDEERLLARITSDSRIFGGKPIIRGRRLAVEHVLGMLAAGDDVATFLEGYPWLTAEDVQACQLFARSQPAV